MLGMVEIESISSLFLPAGRQGGQSQSPALSNWVDCRELSLGLRVRGQGIWGFNENDSVPARDGHVHLRNSFSVLSIEGGSVSSSGFKGEVLKGVHKQACLSFLIEPLGGAPSARDFDELSRVARVEGKLRPLVRCEKRRAELALRKPEHLFLGVDGLTSGF
jgi:hypothetical protein